MDSKRRVKQQSEKNRRQAVLDRLDREYGKDPVCYLNHETPWQLLFSTILSAQCTDERVNRVCPALFEAYPNAYAMAKADVSDIAKYIFSCGLYNSKARDLK